MAIKANKELIVNEPNMIEYYLSELDYCLNFIKHNDKKTYRMIKDITLFQRYMASEQNDLRLIYLAQKGLKRRIAEILVRMLK